MLSAATGSRESRAPVATGIVDPAPLFSPFDLALRRSLAVAVSGGSDSTALLLLLKDWLDINAPRATLHAVTVDHDLRPGSAGEARQVGELCAALGVAHRVLRWDGPKPKTGLLAAAREARYALLARAARAVAADIMFTGHTADDQAETLRMRRARGEGRGLAGMAPLTLFDGVVWIARPLLGLSRQTLREHLRARGQGWTDDPTNADTRYERPRLRATRDPADAPPLADAARAAAARQRLGEAAAGLIAAHAGLAASGLIRLDPAFFRSGAPEAETYALRILLAVAGGSAHLPGQEGAATLAVRLRAGETFRATLSRALLDSRRAGIFLLREARDLPPLAADGDAWDGRYRLSGAGGGKVHAGLGPALASSAPGSLLKRAETTLPALPPGRTATPLLAPWSRFLPCFDLAPARAAAALVGAAEIPAPPWVPPSPGHIDHEP